MRLAQVGVGAGLRAAMPTPLCADVLSSVGVRRESLWSPQNGAGGPPSPDGAEEKPKAFTPGIPPIDGLLHRPREVRGQAGGWEGKALCPRLPGSQQREPGGPGSRDPPVLWGVPLTGGEPWPARATRGQLKVTANSSFTFLSRAGVQSPTSLKLGGSLRLPWLTDLQDWGRGLLGLGWRLGSIWASWNLTLWPELLGKKADLRCCRDHVTPRGGVPSRAPASGRPLQGQGASSLLRGAAAIRIPTSEAALTLLPPGRILTTWVPGMPRRASHRSTQRVTR